MTQSHDVKKVQSGALVERPGGRPLTEVELVEVETKTEPKIQGDAEGLEGHVGAAGGHDQGGGVGLADQGGDGGNQDHGRAGGKEGLKCEMQQMTQKYEAEPE